MDELTMGLKLASLMQHGDWNAFEACMEKVTQRELTNLVTVGDGLPLSRAQARYELATTLLADIEDEINSALSEAEENKQKGTTNG